MDSAFGASLLHVERVLDNLTDCLSSYATPPSQPPRGAPPSVDVSMAALKLESDPPPHDALLRALGRLHQQIADRPYAVGPRLHAAELYRALGFPDLAAGEAYRALLLVDEVLDESGEFHDQALDALVQELQETAVSSRAELAAKNAAAFPDVAQRFVNGRGHAGSESVEAHEDEAAMWAETLWRNAAYTYVAGNLLACGCLKSAHDICLRGLKADAASRHLLKVQALLKQRLSEHFATRGIGLDNDAVTRDDYPDRGFVRRELYPWNAFEPDRYSPESLALLNEQIRSVAPKLEACVTELPLLPPDADPGTSPDVPRESAHATIKQLGVFVREDVAPGEVILDEKSLLTANARLHDSYCDACSAPLPDLHQGSEPSQCVFCDDCDDIVFCSQDCHDLAQEAYHPALCGNDVEAIAKDAPAAEAADALYSLLLLRALAMAETQDAHPLELKELKYIWGDYQITAPGDADAICATPCFPLGCPGTDAFGGRQRTLPFSFSANVLTPLHMLEKMDIDIFAMSSKYDFWVFNTLYAKFRGTASARQGRDGKPDVGAVHPLWCLANHSCDPNVAWEWKGNMRFWARQERVAWKGKEDERKQPGLRKGDEVLSHYCDIDLPVKERREWAAGALGGVCMCERCVWEASLEEKS